MVLRDPARSVAAKLAAAAKINNQRGPLGAATRKREMMIMKRTTSPMSTSSRKPQKPCASMVAPRCILLTANSNSGRVRLLQPSHQSMPRGY